MKNRLSSATGFSLIEALSKFSSKQLWDEFLIQKNKSLGGWGALGRYAERATEKKYSFQQFFLGLQIATSESSGDQRKVKELFDLLVD